eukprot:7387947-Prymnesium_polylepis.1
MCVLPDADNAASFFRPTQIDVKVRVINPAPRRKAHIRRGLPLVSSLAVVATCAVAGARCRRF